MTAGTATVRSRWHRLIEALLPWYDPTVEAARDERTAKIRREAIAARVTAEQVREAYRAAGQRVQR